jgi:radical SAM/Cys-rich protein
MPADPLAAESAAAPPVPVPFRGLRRQALRTLQVNLGYRCNQSCSHCHVNAGPRRTEMLAADAVALIPEVLRARGMCCLDLTGGAPELHPQFRDLVRRVRALGVEVIDRCNLTILSEPGQEDLASFLAQEGVTVVASLPCYTAATVDEQRGEGVFARSLAGLRQLNALGYGQPGSGLVLNLVYNPLGPRLPPPQEALERDYRRELLARHGVRFNSLLALTNMPIQRFAAVLRSQGELEAYQALLEANHQPANLERVMCRTLISVDWQGYLYDCDFNQMLQLPAAGRRQRPHLRDLLDRDPAGDAIAVGSHCFGCTAGAGSSCGGSLSPASASAQP